MRVVFAGTPEVALPSLEAVAASQHELVGVVTRPDAPSGRGRRMTPSPVGARAAELGLPVLKPAHPRDPEFHDALIELGPECCPIVAYGALVPESVLRIPRFGWVNLHFSCLPAWRGAAPVQHAVWAGDEITGATAFQLVPEMDAGPYFGMMTERIGPRDTAGDLLTRLAEGGAGLLVATLDALADGSAQALAQPHEGVSYAPKITVDDARVDWSKPATAIDRQVRACTPFPGAWCLLGEERLKLGPVLPDPELADPELGRLAPGEVAVSKSSVHVGTATDPVRLGEVKAFGKRQMPAADWARGVAVHGLRLG